MYESLKKLYSQLSAHEKKKLFQLAVVIVISSIVQVVGVASIFPFIAVATNPEVIDSNTYLSWFKSLFNINDNQDFLLVLGGVVLATLVLTNLFLAFSTWLTVSFIETMLNTMAYRMLQRYLNEHYLFHLSRNSAELMKNITTEVNRVVNGGFMSAITIVSKGFSAVCILLFLIAVDPLIAAIMGGVLSGSYLIIYFTIRKKLARVGVEATQLFSERYRYINESLGGIKDLMVLGREKMFLERFRAVSRKVIERQIYKRSVSELPRFLLETIAFGGILTITIFLVAVKDDAHTVLPMIALYGLAGYRLMPALQGIFQSTANLKHDIAAVDLFYDDLQGAPRLSIEEAAQANKRGDSLALVNEITLKDISFRYPNVDKDAINNLSFNVKANTSVGIVGSSGSGKSTLVDLILGLLQPVDGSMSIDGKQLTSESLSAWQNNIGYVPQVIFLADSTISENIAFGIPRDEIDQAAVTKAAEMANLHEFIVNELSDGYKTVVGERGIRLSGGQRQRIGIARALYHDPSVLVLDEATSALDTPTEKAVMESVYKMSHKKTIIIIAHRLTTIKNCDSLLWLEKGRLMAQGSYADLVQSNSAFKEFANHVEVSDTGEESVADV